MNLSDINRDMPWGTIHGETIRLKNMEDSHLINVYHYLTSLIDPKKNSNTPMYFKVRGVLCELMEERGIDINKYPGPVPYKKNGRWLYHGYPATEGQILAYKLGLFIPMFTKEELEERGIEIQDEKGGKKCLRRLTRN